MTLPSVLDGGHGGRNRLKGGSTETLEHGWFGHTTLIGGTGPNQLIGRAGQVKFRPSKSTDLIFAGKPMRRTFDLNPTPPGGTFYVYKKGHLIPVPLSDLYSTDHDDHQARSSQEVIRVSAGGRILRLGGLHSAAVDDDEARRSTFPRTGRETLVSHTLIKRAAP